MNIGTVRRAFRRSTARGITDGGVVNGTGFLRERLDEGDLGRVAAPARVLSRLGVNDGDVLAGERVFHRPEGRAGREPLPPVVIADIVRTSEVLMINIERIHRTSPMYSKACIDSFMSPHHEHPCKAICWNHRRAEMSVLRVRQLTVLC
ncbi:hypothetical protein [Microbispora sp. NBC_01389]|uniref:hypothetical protein n=1 Tax=Microbispora sp. NBC_01389 TaxID=2903584 RepID=UPI00324C2EA8